MLNINVRLDISVLIAIYCKDKEKTHAWIIKILLSFTCFSVLKLHGWISRDLKKMHIFLQPKSFEDRKLLKWCKR